MQICNTASPQYTQNTMNLHKIASLPALQNTQMEEQTNYCEITQQKYWKTMIRWILKLSKQVSISKGTLFLSISYLRRIVFDYELQLNDNNYEKIAMVLVLMGAKMNEIYPPKMSTLVGKCNNYWTKEELMKTQEQILQLFNYDMSFSQTSYTHLFKMLQNEQIDKIEDAQKLLKLSISCKKIAASGEQLIALGIVYLIKPSLMREFGYENIFAIKAVAAKIYNLYIENKSRK